MTLGVGNRLGVYKCFWELVSGGTRGTSITEALTIDRVVFFTERGAGGHEVEIRA
jgi:hypothetical protein